MCAATIEEFGLIVVRHFLTEYPHCVNRCTVDIERDRWERISCKDSNGVMRPHNHAFQRMGHKPFVRVTAEKRGSSPMTITMSGGLRGLEVLKTTQSGFIDFHKCRNTTLPSEKDRLVGTSVEAEWTYSQAAVTRRLDFAAINKSVEDALITTFTGPADVGVYSKSVQETMYLMGVEALRRQPVLEKISLYMPNLHNMPFPLENIGLKRADHTGSPDIFYPIDEPHGMIKATVHRSSAMMRSRL